MKVTILIEDTYGKPFMDGLIKDLKSKEFVDRSWAFKVNQYNVYKLNKMLKAATDSDKIILFVDCDGDCNNNNARSIHEICEKQNNGKIGIIDLMYEIEDWLCISEGMKLGNQKSSSAIMAKTRYEKFRLPEYSTKLNVELLMKNCKSFKDFIILLKE